MAPLIWTLCGPSIKRGKHEQQITDYPLNSAGARFHNKNGNLGWFFPCNHTAEPPWTGVIEMEKGKSDYIPLNDCYSTDICYFQRESYHHSAFRLPSRGSVEVDEGTSESHASTLCGPSRGVSVKGAEFTPHEARKLVGIYVPISVT